MSGADAPPTGLARRLFARLIHIYFRFARGLTMGVRAIALDGAGNVFLVRHTYVPGWHLPGGGVEAGETCARALERELEEEANIVMAGPPRLLGIYFNTKATRRDHVAVYVVEKFRQTAPRLADREIAEARFFPLSALPGGTTLATRHRLAEALEGAPPDPFWTPRS